MSDHDHEASEIRIALGACVRGGRGRAFPGEVRERALAYATARRAEGASVVGVAGEIGLSWRTLERWLHPTARASRAKSLVRPVAIAAASTPKAIVVHAPHGVRVEGLDVATLAELLARLG